MSHKINLAVLSIVIAAFLLLSLPLTSQFHKLSSAGFSEFDGSLISSEPKRSSNETKSLPILTRNISCDRGYRDIAVLGGNTTVKVPADLNLSDEYERARVASEMISEELSRWRDILIELLRKEFSGNYSEEFIRDLELARTGKYNSYLWPVLKWMDEGLSNEEMVDRVLKRMHALTRELSVYRFREGALLSLCGYLNLNQGRKNSCVDVLAGLSVLDSGNLSDEYERARVASEMISEELSRWRDILIELLRKEFSGNYSEEFIRDLELARTGKYNSYLWPVLKWMDEGLSNEEMVDRVLKRMHALTRELSVYRFREGAWFVASRIREGGVYVLTYCDPPGKVLPTGWNYLHDFERSGNWVWVGCYSSTRPYYRYFIGEYCTYTYTTDMGYYWNIAQQECGDSLKSIQVKWFHRAYPMPPDDNWKHDFIWEGNKNSQGEWYTYGDPYDDTSPDSGYYYVKANYYYVLQCCQSINNFCNFHCRRCFACDADASQHFIGRP